MKRKNLRYQIYTMQMKKMKQTANHAIKCKMKVKVIAKVNQTMEIGLRNC